MIQGAEALWKALRGKITALIKTETSNTMRVAQYIVTTPPNGSVIGVTLPLGEKEIFVPYSQELSGASEGDVVTISWFNSLSNAKAVWYGSGYNGIISDYSTSEINTGAKWVDGSDIYKRTFIADNPTFISEYNSYYIGTLEHLKETIKLESVSANGSIALASSLYPPFANYVAANTADLGVADIAGLGAPDIVIFTIWYTKP